MSIIKFNIQQLEEITTLINSFSDNQYTEKLELIGGSTIGQHFRHIIEFYQSIVNMENDLICFDDRKRELKIEVDGEFAVEQIAIIILKLQSMNLNKTITLRSNYNVQVNEIVYLPSSLYRELAYALDHAIHHLAIIKIAVAHSGWNMNLDANLGVAPSTVRYKSNVYG